jgi:phosphate starvation-inducible PhoH-like protein
MGIKKSKEKPKISYHERINFKPRNKGQEIYINSILYNDITFCSGVAGTGKGACAVATALKLFWAEESLIQKIVITRPTIPLGRGIGFLPGGIADKMDLYLIPLYS